jgi:ATP-dependent helicase/nuclease subunit B
VSRPRVYTIPSSVRFLPTLARALLDGELVPGFAPRDDPLALARATVFLPTRRAVRAFGDALLDALGADAALLPRIVPLGDVDEDALAFAETTPVPTRPSPISPTARRMVLAQLVLKFAQVTAKSGRPLVTATPAAALLLAEELARLFDDMTIAGVSFDALDEDAFVPTALDEYWRQSLEFLKVARAGWEAHLNERGLVDTVEWRDRLLTREAALLAAGRSGPVIAAGSTGSIPAVANLIDAIARRPDGAVVLPGLDQIIDDATFALIDGGKESGGEIEASPGHPQFGLKRLLGRLGLARDEVTALGAQASTPRERLLSEAFRPAATTDRWAEIDNGLERDAAHALAAVAFIDAADAREEALALAIALREISEQPSATAALVTPDRTLARRVAAELRRWGLVIDDSAGVTLADTDAGRLSLLVANAAAEALAPVQLISLLRHPLVARGLDAGAIDALEIAVLRGPRPAPGAQGLAQAVDDMRARKGELHRRDPRAHLPEIAWEQAARLARRAGAMLEPLTQLNSGEAFPFARLLEAHRLAIANAGLDFEQNERPDVRALARSFDEFEAAAADAAPLRLGDYADAFGQLLATEPPVRPPFDRRARIRILGPLEARLLDSDRVLLGALNEGTWPAEAHVDAWLNRPMRKRLKLDLPERRIGLAAHDFVQTMGARQVVLSRARKQNGVETVASRFLQRLQAIVPETEWDKACERGARYRDLARDLERPEKPRPIERPAPTPPLTARPARLSVTEIETLIRDPYSIYARHILRLYPLDAVDADPTAAERGTVIHEALAEFTRAYPARLPERPLDELLTHGKKAFAVLKDFPSLTATWWPRFERAARWLVEIERERRAEIEQIFAETSGAIEFDAGGHPFRLTARADRIERRLDGAVAVIDYKTGEPPSLRQAIIGLAPQLALEAAIVKAGGFKDIPKVHRVADIVVIKPSGGDPPGKLISLDPARASGEAKKLADARQIKNADDLAEYASTCVRALLAAFADATAAYQSIPRPKWRNRFGDYDHLARIKEWSASDEIVE